MTNDSVKTINAETSDGFKNKALRKNSSKNVLVIDWYYNIAQLKQGVQNYLDDLLMLFQLD